MTLWMDHSATGSGHLRLIQHGNGCTLVVVAAKGGSLIAVDNFLAIKGMLFFLHQILRARQPTQRLGSHDAVDHRLSHRLRGQRADQADVSALVAQ